MYKKYIKRILDVIFAILLFPIFGVSFVVVGILIKHEDNGSVFYCAERLGKNAHRFKMYKFRSMRENAPDIRNEDGSTYNSSDDQRQTKIGRILRKTSVDEVPQIINVLKGEMSFIGPRPHVAGNSKKFVEKREFVRPGITGYSQAHYRNSILSDEKVRKDEYYVDHISFVLDFKIFVKTIQMIIRRQDIYTKKAEKRT